MNCHSTISVFELLGSSIHSRAASATLMQLIENDPCNYIELDFSEVEHISRSFADQFHVDKMNCSANLQKTIIVVNASDAVIHLLQAVARSQNAVNRKIDEVPVYKYTSHSQLENFFFSF